MSASKTAPAPSVAAPELVERFHREGWILLPGAIPVPRAAAWRDAFLPLLERQAATEPSNRGPQRWQSYVPFTPPFDDPSLIANPQVLAVLRAVLGEDAACTLLGADTPLPGATRQDVHQDLPAISGQEALATFIIGLNTALVPFTDDNGPMELWPGSHRWPAVGVDRNAAVAQRPGLRPLLQPGDILLRDLRLWHRGTENRSHARRPMLAATYMVPWFRFGMDPIEIPRSRYEAMTAEHRHLLRFNALV